MNALQLPGAVSFGCLRGFLLLVQPWHVVVRHFFERVERDDVVHVEIDAVRFHPVGDALQFLLVFGVDVRPEHLAGGGAEELPVALGLVRVEELDGFERVGDFRREKVAVLKADVGGRAFEMNVGPSALLEAIGLLQPGIGRTRAGLCHARPNQGEAQHARATKNFDQHVPLVQQEVESEATF